MLERAIASDVGNLKKSIMMGTSIAPPPIPATLQSPIIIANTKKPPISRADGGKSYLWTQTPYKLQVYNWVHSESTVHPKTNVTNAKQTKSTNPPMNPFFKFPY